MDAPAPTIFRLTNKTTTMADELIEVTIIIRNVPKDRFEISVSQLKEIAKILDSVNMNITNNMVMDYRKMRIDEFLQITGVAIGHIFSRQVIANFKKEEDENNKNTES